MTTHDEIGAEDPDIIAVEPGAAAVAWGRVPFVELPAYHRSARTKVDAALAAAGVTPDGPRLTFSRAPSGGSIAIAPGIMIGSTFSPPDDEVTIETIPKGRAAHLRLRGPYQHLPQAWGALSAWVAARDLPTTGLCWEVYTDPSGPTTDLYVMLAEAPARSAA